MQQAGNSQAENLKIRDRRAILVFVFLPGLYLMLAIGILLTTLAGTGLIYGLWKLSMLVHWVPIGVVIVLGLGVLYGILVLLRGGASSIRRAELAVHSERITEQDGPELYQLIEGLCDDLECTQPDNLILALDPSLFVTEAVVYAMPSGNRLTGRTLCVSASILRAMTTEELRAVLSHELAHFTGRDTAYSRWFYPIYQGTLAAIGGLSAPSESGSDSAGLMMLPLLPTLLLIGGYLSIFARIERRLSRERELRADLAGARIVSPIDMGGALIKASLLASAWRDVVAEQCSGTDKDLALNLSIACVERARELASEQHHVEKPGLDSGFEHPTDSHPPLFRRLQSLGVEENLDSFEWEEGSALVLVPNISAIENDLSVQFSAALSRLAGNSRQQQMATPL